MRLPAAMRPLVWTVWMWSKGCCGGGGAGMTSGGFGLRVGMGSLADLDEVGVTVEAEDLATGGGDVEGSPCGVVEERDGGAAYGFEAGEAVGDLGFELGVEMGFGGFVFLCGGELDFDAM